MALGKAYDKYFSLKNEPIFFFFNGEWFGGNLLGFFPSPSQAHECVFPLCLSVSHLTPFCTSPLTCGPAVKHFTSTS